VWAAHTDTSKQEHGLKNIEGAFTTQSRVFWPYRLVTGIFQYLLERYSERFSLETRTPVNSITVAQDSDSAYPYVLTTPRGVIRAAKVFHCVSAFTGHLLPKFRGPVFPCRLTMSAAEPGPQFGNRAVSWLWRIPQTYDPETGLVEQGLYWMQQNAETGDLFYGGDIQKLGDFIAANDSTVSVDAANNLKTLLPKRIFARGWTDPSTGAQISSIEPHHTWCGILSMTADQLAIVGAVPTSLSGRNIDGGEWVAAGFNGYGMGQCWSSGEAIARMAWGEPKPEWLPDVYLSTEERLTSPYMSTEAALGSFLQR
jgi:glycine/D-amino acid oxidase-like deaminating enzyme